MQKLIANKPVKLVTDRHESLLKSDEATYLKNYRISFTSNQNHNGDEGGNMGAGTGLNSTVPAVPMLTLPSGTNKNVGAKFVPETNRLYFLNWNSNGLSAIYRIDCSTRKAQIVIMDRRLDFSIDPKHYVSPHRIDVTIVYGSDALGNRYVKDEIVKYVDGKNWQRWINVESAIATNGFDPVLFPYFALKAPHYDFTELIDWPVRPPMISPKITPIERKLSDGIRPNNLVNKSIQIAYVFVMTDGRKSVLSPYSTPYIYQQKSCSSNNLSTPRCLDVELYAGSPLVEKILVLQRACGGDWKLYDTLEKYSNCGKNDPAVIGDRFWERTDPWAGYSYDPQKNTIRYNYCGDRECRAYSVADAIRFQSDIPIVSTSLTPAGDAVLLGNNLRDYDNLDCSVLDNLRPTVLTQDNKTACAVKMVNIKLYAYICRADQTNQFVYRNGESGQVRFGGLYPLMPFGLRDPLRLFDPGESDRFGLNFGENHNFICYLAGTSYYAIGKQVRISGGMRSEIGPIDINNSSSLDAAKNTIFNDEGYFMQEFEFNVPAGNYIARLAGHSADLGSAYQKTSTYTLGIVGAPVLGSQGVGSNSMNQAKEIVVRACNSDYDGFGGTVEGVFYVFAPYSRLSVNNRTEELGRFIDGYLQESSDSRIGVELVNYNANHGSGNFIFKGAFTDHNGFFFVAAGGGNARETNIDFFGRFNCTAASGNRNFSTSIPGDQRGFYPSQNIFAKVVLGNSYGPCNRILVKGRITDINSGQGLSGAGITITFGGTFYSDAEGNFEIVVHPHPTTIRTGQIFFGAGGGCAFVEADCRCLPVEDFSEALMAPCTSCNERIYPVSMSKQFRMGSYNESTLKEGGRYPVGVIVADLAGRGTYINNIGYVDVPSITDVGKVVPSKIQVSVLGSLGIPSHFKWISFFVGRNLINKKFLQWVGDGIEFLDINGDVAPNGNGAILAKITIQSLLDFNIRNNFSTTTGYQFVAGDRIKIYDDGKGNIIPPGADGSVMEYEIRGTDFNTVTDSGTDEGSNDAKSLIIDYDSRLLKLKDSCGFWIEIVSPRDCTDLEKYGMTGGFIPLVNGEIVGGNSIVLEAFDSFIINRNVTIKTCSGNTLNHPFISSSVSDYWGEGCASTGKELVKDENAQQRWYKDEIIKSDERVNEGRVNGLGTFRDTNIKRFKGELWGGIVAMHTERGIIAYICENDWFVTNFQQEFVKTTAAGLLIANTDENVSNPNQKIGDNFGCAYEDTATIDFFDGLCIFYDRKNSAVLMMNYNGIRDISKIDNKSYFINKSKLLQNHNSSLSAERYLLDLFEATGKVDPQSRTYNLTLRKRNGLSQSPENFANNEREIFYDVSETICFSLEGGFWSGFTGYVPEAYERVPQSGTGDELVSFVAGVPFYHNSRNAPGVNVFYGVSTDQVIEIVAQGEESKDKTLHRIAIESNGPGYFIDSLTTSVPDIYSYVPMPYFGKLSNVYYSRLLMNTNVFPDRMHPVASTLIDGGSLYGQWCRIRLVKNLAQKDVYNELTNIFVTVNDKEKSKK